jgi:hypothetical protein
LFRYSRLCGMASDAVDVVKLEIPQGSKYLKFKMSEFFNNIVRINNFKNLKRSLRFKYVFEINTSGDNVM